MLYLEKDPSQDLPSIPRGREDCAMTHIILLEALGVLLAWFVAGFAIWKWGPGMRTRRVRCPETGKRAAVLAKQKESEFGCLRVTDVTKCSLIPRQALFCEKTCIAKM